MNRFFTKNGTQTTFLSFLLWLGSLHFAAAQCENLDAGIVQTVDNQTEALICLTYSYPNTIGFINSSTNQNKYSYLITNNQGVILNIPNQSYFNFLNAGEGTCRVYGAAYLDELPLQVGDNLTEIDATADCIDISDNYITIVRSQIAGNSINIAGSQEQLSLTEGNSSLLKISNTSTTTANYTYLLADQSQTILEVNNTGEIDLKARPEGKYFIWGFSHMGEVLLQVGQPVFTAPFASGCSMRAENALVVNKYTPAIICSEEVAGGQITTTMGFSNIEIEQDAEEIPIVSVIATNTHPSANYTYLITDSVGTILNVSTTPTYDFSTTEEGQYLIYGLSYTGNLTVFLGQSINSTLSDCCFSLSENAVVITLNATEEITELPCEERVEGGDILEEQGFVFIFFEMIGDGIPDIVKMDSFRVNPNSMFTYVITNELDIIVDIPEGDTFDFDQTGGGEARIYGISYTGNLLIEPGDDIRTAVLSDDCYDLAGNWVTVFRFEVIPSCATQVEGGQIFASDGATEVIVTATSDNESNFIALTNVNSKPDANYTYIITDIADIILAVSPADEIDINTIGVSEIRIYGLSYTGNLSAIVGQNINNIDLSNDCFDISDNFIQVIQEEEEEVIGCPELVEGGDILTSEGYVLVTFENVGDGQSDLVEFDSFRINPMSKFIYLITDETNLLLATSESDVIDFENENLGERRVYGLSYTGNLTLETGTNIYNESLSDECYDLSGNYVTIIRLAPCEVRVSGGRVAVGDGATTVTISTINDGVPDLIEFYKFGDAPEENYRFLITDELGDIMVIPDTSAYDFDLTTEGTCLIYGVSFSGSFKAEIGANIHDILLSNSCFELSENFITVIKQALTPLMSVYPNPAIEQLHTSFELTVIKNANAQLTVTDNFGRIMLTKMVQIQEGYNEFRVPLHSLAGGWYNLTLITKGQQLQQRFLKQLN